MTQLLASVALATGLLCWVIRDALVAHGRVVRAVAADDALPHAAAGGTADGREPPR